MLSNHELGATEVAELVAFYDKHHPTKVFQQMCGLFHKPLSKQVAPKIITLEHVRIARMLLLIGHVGRTGC
jgi:hypothetical protein